MRGLPELKVADGTDTYFPTVAGVFKPSFNLIGQGVGENQRIGNQIVAKRIEIRCKCSNEAVSLVTAGCVWSVALVLDKQCNGASPSTGDIFEDVASDGPLAYNRIENKDRFVILRRKIFANNTLALPNTTSGGKVYKYFSWSVPLNFKINYGGPTNAITEIKSNNLMLVAMTDNNTGTLIVQQRFKFIDC